MTDAVAIEGQTGSERQADRDRLTTGTKVLYEVADLGAAMWC